MCLLNRDDLKQITEIPFGDVLQAVPPSGEQTDRLVSDNRLLKHTLMVITGEEFPNFCIYAGTTQAKQSLLSEFSDIVGSSPLIDDQSISPSLPISVVKEDLQTAEQSPPKVPKLCFSTQIQAPPTSDQSNVKLEIEETKSGNQEDAEAKLVVSSSQRQKT